MIAVVAVLAVLATKRGVDPPVTHPPVMLPESGRWQVAVAAELQGGVLASGCGLVVGLETLAVSHPVLPCGVRVVLQLGKRSASVQVAGRATAPGGAAFGLTPQLAKALGLKPGAPAGSVRWALGLG